MSGNVGVATDNLNVNPMPPPQENTLTPSLKFPIPEHMTAFFDNVYINGVLYEDFDSYTSIGQLDPGKWNSWHENAAIENQQLKLDVHDVIGRGHAGVSFTDPASIHAIRADITVDTVSSDGPPQARIIGYFCNNGTGDVSGKIAVKQDKVYYSVSEDFINSQGTYQWHILDTGELMGVGPGQTVTASVSWDGTTLAFDADGNTAYYTPTGDITPPIDYNYKQLQVRLNLVTEDTSTHFQSLTSPGSGEGSPSNRPTRTWSYSCSTRPSPRLAR